MNVRKDKLTPRFKGWLDQAMDQLEKERVNQKRDIIGKLADMIYEDPMRYGADLERREQAAGAPAAALGGPSIDIKQLWLTAVQAKPEPMKVIEAEPSSGTERVPNSTSHWDH